MRGFHSFSFFGRPAEPMVFCVLDPVSKTVGWYGVGDDDEVKLIPRPPQFKHFGPGLPPLRNAYDPALCQGLREFRTGLLLNETALGAVFGLSA